MHDISARQQIISEAENVLRKVWCHSLVEISQNLNDEINSTDIVDMASEYTKK